MLYSHGKMPPYRKYVKVDFEAMREAKKGEEFLIIVEATPIPAERACELAQAIKANLKEKFNIELHYIAIKENEIIMYISGSPFTWAALIAWLPILLGLFGIIMIGIGVWQAFASVPSWVYATIIAGILILYVSPHVARMLGEKR